MTTRKIAIRLGVDSNDRAEVRRNFNELKTEGVNAFGAVGQSAVTAGRQNDAHTASLKRIVAEAQALKSTMAQRINMTVGINYDDASGSARASAMAFEAHFKAQEDGANRVRAALAANEAALNPLAAAQDRLNAELAEYNALAKAGSISNQELAAAEGLARARFDEARQSILQKSDAYRSEQQAIAERTSSAEKLRAALMAEQAAINPLGAAQDRLNAELAEYNALAKAGAISTKELAAAEALARKRFDETSLAIQRSGGLSRAHRAGRLNLARQGADVFTTAAMGMDPMMIAIQQGPQILDAMAMSGIKVSRSMLMAGAALTAFGGAAIGAGAAVISFSDAQYKAELTLMGLGRASGLTAALFEAHARTSADAARITVGAAREQQAAILNAGVSNTSVMDGLIRLNKDYAVATGQDAKEAAKALGVAFADPTKGAEKLSRELGLLDYATLKQIQSLDEQGRKLEAQNLLLEKAQERFEGAAEKTFGWSKAWRELTSNASKYFAVIGQTLTPDSMMDPDQAIIRRLGGDRKVLTGSEQRELAAARDRVRQQENAARIQAVEDGRVAAEKDALLVAEKFLPVEQKRLSLVHQRSHLQTALDNKVIEGADNQAKAKRAIAAIDKEIAELDKGKTDRRAERLGREAAASRINAEMGWAMVDAMENGASAMRIAEIRRDAYTEATRKGTNAEAEYQRQLAEVIANEAVNGARQVADIEARVAVQGRYNDMVASGSLSRQEANLQAQIEIELSALAIARDQATGAEKEKLIKIYDALKAARERDNDEQIRGQIIDATKANNDEVAFLEKQLEFIRLTNDERAIALAREQAYRDLEKMDPNMTADQRAAYINSKVGEARAGNDLRRAEYLEGMRRADERDMQTSQRLLEIAHLTERERDKAMRQLQRELDLKEQGVEKGTEEYRLAMERLKLSDELADSADRQLEYFDKIHAMQEGAIDRFAGLVTEGNYNLKDWRDTAVDAIQDVIAEAILLSAINPFKNWALGTDLPTTGNGGVMGMLGDLMSGGGKGSSGFMPDQRGKSASTIIDMMGSLFGGFRANGGPIEPGKAYVVGERGPELFMAMERGLIVPNHQISAANDNAAMVRKAVNAPAQQVFHQHFHLHAENAVMTPDLMADLSKQADEISKKNIRQGLKEYSKTTPDQVAGYEARPRWRKG